MQTTIRPRRSFIFTPGLNPAMFAKALGSGADMVCIELEDGIAPKDKALARARTLEIFRQPMPATSVEVIVRINCLRDSFGLNDVAEILQMPFALPALMLPKVRTADEVRWLDDLLTERGFGTDLHIIIETNEGLEAASEIARSSPRVKALFFGGVDMAAELGCKNQWDSLLYARSRVIHAAAGAGLDAIDVPYLDLEDPVGLAVAARQARDLGFSGKGSIHPKQIPIITEVFTPDEEAISHAKRILTAFEQADTGLVVIDGKLIEKPVLREMRRILAIAERVEKLQKSN